MRDVSPIDSKYLHYTKTEPSISWAVNKNSREMENQKNLEKTAADEKSKSNKKDKKNLNKSKDKEANLDNSSKDNKKDKTSKDKASKTSKVKEDKSSKDKDSRTVKESKSSKEKYSKEKKDKDSSKQKDSKEKESKSSKDVAKSKSSKEVETKTKKSVKRKKSKEEKDRKKRKDKKRSSSRKRSKNKSRTLSKSSESRSTGSSRDHSMTPPLSFTPPKHYPLVKEESVTPPIETSPFQLKCRYDNSDDETQIKKEPISSSVEDEYELEPGEIFDTPEPEPSTTPPIELLKVEKTLTPPLIQDQADLDDLDIEDSPLQSSEIEAMNAKISDCFDELLLGVEKTVSPPAEEYTASKWEAEDDDDDEAVSNNSDEEEKTELDIIDSANVFDPIILSSKYEEFMKCIGDTNSLDMNRPVLQMKPVRSRSSSVDSMGAKPPLVPKGSSSSGSNSGSSSNSSSDSSTSGEDSSTESSDESSSSDGDDDDDDDDDDDEINEADKESLLKKTLIKLMQIIPENCSDDLTKIDSANLKAEIRKLLDSDFGMLKSTMMVPIPPAATPAITAPVPFFTDSKKVSMSIETRKLNQSNAISETVSENTIPVHTPTSGVPTPNTPTMAVVTPNKMVPNFSTQIYKISEHSVGFELTPKRSTTTTPTTASGSAKESPVTSTPSSAEKKPTTETKVRRGPRTPSRERDRGDKEKFSRKRSPSPSRESKRKSRSRSRDRHRRDRDSKRQSSGKSEKDRKSTSSSYRKTRSHSKSPPHREISSKRSRSRRSRSRSPISQQKRPSSPPPLRVSRSPSSIYRRSSRSPSPNYRRSPRSPPYYKGIPRSPPLPPNSPLSPPPKRIRSPISPPLARRISRSRSFTPPDRRSRSPLQRIPRSPSPYYTDRLYHRPPSPKDLPVEYADTSSGVSSNMSWHLEMSASSSGYGGSGYPESPQRISLDERIDIALGRTPPPTGPSQPPPGVVRPPQLGPGPGYPGYDYRPPMHNVMGHPLHPIMTTPIHDYRMPIHAGPYYPTGPGGPVCVPPNNQQFMPRHYPPPNHLHPQHHQVPHQNYYQPMPPPFMNNLPPPQSIGMQYPPPPHLTGGPQLANIREVPIHQHPPHMNHNQPPPSHSSSPHQPIPISQSSSKSFTRVGNCLEIIPSSPSVISSVSVKSEPKTGTQNHHIQVEKPDVKPTVKIDKESLARQKRKEEKERKRAEKLIRKVRLRLELEKIEEIWSEMFGSGVDHDFDDGPVNVVNSNGGSFLDDDDEDDEEKEKMTEANGANQNSDDLRRGIIKGTNQNRPKKKNVLFSDGIQPGHGTSASEDDLKPEKKKKKVRKQKPSQNKENNNENEKSQIPLTPLKSTMFHDVDDEKNEPPPPPPGSPPAHCIQPRLKNPPAPEFLYFHLNPIENRLIVAPYRPHFPRIHFPPPPINLTFNHQQPPPLPPPQTILNIPPPQPPPPQPLQQQPQQQQQQQPLLNSVLNLQPHQIRGITIDPALVRLIRSQAQNSPQLETTPKN